MACDGGSGSKRGGTYNPVIGREHIFENNNPIYCTQRFSYLNIYRLPITKSAMVLTHGGFRSIETVPWVAQSRRAEGVIIKEITMRLTYKNSRMFPKYRSSREEGMTVGGRG